MLTRLSDAAELYEEIQDNKEARKAYEEAARWYEDDNAGALANKLSLKAGDLAALDGEYVPAIQHYEHVAKQSISNNLMRFSVSIYETLRCWIISSHGLCAIDDEANDSVILQVKDYLLRAGICHLAHDIIGAKRAIESYRELDPGFAQTREFQLLNDSVEAMEAGDSEMFAEKLYRYDQLSPLNPWFTSMLLRCVYLLKFGGGTNT